MPWLHGEHPEWRNYAISEYDQVSGLAAIIAIVTLLTVAAVKTCALRLPGFLIALSAGAALAAATNTGENGVEMLGAIPAALPYFAAPYIGWSDLALLASGAAAVTLVSLLEAISIGRAFALRHLEPFAPNQEIVAQGLSNTVGSFFQCYAGSGSFTRSGVNAESEATSPLSAIFASFFLAAILLVFGSFITVIPKPAMAALILYVAWRLIDRKEDRHIITTSRPKTLIFVPPLGAGLLLELDFAIYIGVIAAFSVFTYHSAYPSMQVRPPVLAASGRRKFRNADLHGVPECPQVVVVRLDSPLYFGSIERVEAASKAFRADRATQKHVIFYLKGAGKIDLSGADFLIHAIRKIRAQGGSFHIVALYPPLLECRHRFHVLEEIGEDHLHISKGDALAAILTKIDLLVCKNCVKRVLLEWTDLPKPKM